MTIEETVTTTTTATVKSPPTVGVIGCGPAGMFFLRALEERRRRSGGDEAVVPIVTVFEREATCGGVWREAPEQPDHPETNALATIELKKNRTTKDNTDEEEEVEEAIDKEESSSDDNSDSDDDSSDDEEADELANPRTSTVMYPELWTNGPKEGFEFADYTFEDHFGKSLNAKIPSYIPRSTALGYLTHRVTRHAPQLLQNSVRYHQSVENVTYDASRSKFTMTTRDTQTEEVTSHEFDYVVWAAGKYQGRTIPKEYRSMFAPSAYEGRVLHSNNVYEHAPDDLYRNKHVVLIGGSYSAMDLALQANRHRARTVSILVRRIELDGPVGRVLTWPFDNVHVYKAQVAVRAVGKQVQLARWDSANECIKEETTLLEEVDTVIFCTGYTANYKMLDRSVFGDLTDDEWEAVEEEEHPFKAPDDWEMEPTPMDDWIAEGAAHLGLDEPTKIPPFKEWLDSETPYTSFMFADAVFSGNPRLFIFDGSWGSLFLMYVDIQAHIMVSCLMGDLVVPPKDVVVAENRRAVLDQQMHKHVGRYWLDETYRKADRAKEHPEGPWAPGDQVRREYYDYNHMRMGYLAHLCKYPIQLLEGGGTPAISSSSWSFVPQEWKLNEAGRLLFHYDWYDLDTDLTQNGGRTLRDVSDARRQLFASHLTGNVPAPLPQLWIDLPCSYDPEHDQTDDDGENHGKAAFLKHVESASTNKSLP